MVTQSRVLPSKCTRCYGAICALCFDTPIELHPGSTITDGDETTKSIISVTSVTHLSLTGPYIVVLHFCTVTVTTSDNLGNHRQL